MSELVETVGGAAMPGFLTALLVFGFAPGFVLRLIVKLYPRADPRRRELVAELYTIPRIVRPMWVAEQIETALFEGLGARRRLRVARRLAFRAAVAADSEYREVRKATGVTLGFTALLAGSSTHMWFTEGLLEMPFAIKQVMGIVLSALLLLMTPFAVFGFLRMRRELVRRLDGDRPCVQDGEVSR